MGQRHQHLTDQPEDSVEENEKKTGGGAGSGSRGSKLLLLMFEGYSTFLTAVMPNAKFTVSGIHNHNLNH